MGKEAKPFEESIVFVKAGDQPAKRTSAGILTSARDWQLLVDLQQQLKFFNHIAVTTRLDIVLVSEYM